MTAPQQQHRRRDRTAPGEWVHRVVEGGGKEKGRGAHHRGGHRPGTRTQQQSATRTSTKKVKEKRGKAEGGAEEGRRHRRGGVGRAAPPVVGVILEILFCFVGVAALRLHRRLFLFAAPVCDRACWGRGAFVACTQWRAIPWCKKTQKKEGRRNGGGGGSGNQQNRYTPTHTNTHTHGQERRRRERKRNGA